MSYSQMNVKKRSNCKKAKKGKICLSYFTVSYCKKKVKHC